MRPSSRTLSIPMLVLLVAALLAPAPAAAGSYLMTGFVPELATPTFEVTYGYHDDDLLGHDLKKTVTGFRLGYVPYPALEVMVELDSIAYDLDVAEGQESGWGGGLTLKYQVPPLFEEFDLAAAVTASYGSSDHISEYEVGALALVSRDISEGWTPYAGLGIRHDRQEFDGSRTEPAFWESWSYDFTGFFGIKYMFMNHFGAQIDGFYRDGFGAEAAISYRY